MPGAESGGPDWHKSASKVALAGAAAGELARGTCRSQLEGLGCIGRVRIVCSARLLSKPSTAKPSSEGGAASLQMRWQRDPVRFRLSTTYEERTHSHPHTHRPLLLFFPTPTNQNHPFTRLPRRSILQCNFFWDQVSV